MFDQLPTSYCSCHGYRLQYKKYILRILYYCKGSGLTFSFTVRTKNRTSSLDHVLWDRNPGFLKSEIGPFSGFKRKSYLMDLKSAHSQESDFQESGEVDRFLKMGTHFQERLGSLENGLCVTWSGFWVCPGYLWLLILVAVEQIYDQITRRFVAQRVAPAARVILSQIPSFRRWRLLMETMAYWQQVSLSLPRCSYLFVLQRPRTLVHRAHIVLKTSPQENAHLTIYQGASGREKRSDE